MNFITALLALFTPALAHDPAPGIFSLRGQVAIEKCVTGPTGLKDCAISAGNSPAPSIPLDLTIELACDDYEGVEPKACQGLWLGHFPQDGVDFGAQIVVIQITNAESKTRTQLSVGIGPSSAPPSQENTVQLYLQGAGLSDAVQFRSQPFAGAPAPDGSVTSYSAQLTLGTPPAPGT